MAGPRLTIAALATLEQRVAEYRATVVKRAHITNPQSKHAPPLPLKPTKRTEPEVRQYEHELQHALPQSERAAADDREYEPGVVADPSGLNRPSERPRRRWLKYGLLLLVLVVVVAGASWWLLPAQVRPIATKLFESGQAALTALAAEFLTWFAVTVTV